MESTLVVLLRLCGNAFAVEHGRTRFVRKGGCRLDQRPALELLRQDEPEADDAKPA